MATPVPRSIIATAGKPFLISVTFLSENLPASKGFSSFRGILSSLAIDNLQQYTFQAFSPDISYPLGRPPARWSLRLRERPSSPFEANEFQRILRRFYDYSLDRSLDRLKGLG